MKTAGARGGHSPSLSAFGEPGAGHRPTLIPPLSPLGAAVAAPRRHGKAVPGALMGAVQLPHAFLRHVGWRQAAPDLTSAPNPSPRPALTSKVSARSAPLLALPPLQGEGSNRGTQGALLSEEQRGVRTALPTEGRARPSSPRYSGPLS